jgi:hypothetical protein
MLKLFTIPTTEKDKKYKADYEWPLQHFSELSTDDQGEVIWALSQRLWLLSLEVEYQKWTIRPRNFWVNFLPCRCSFERWWKEEGRSMAIELGRIEYKNLRGVDTPMRNRINSPRKY